MSNESTAPLLRRSKRSKSSKNIHVNVANANGSTRPNCRNNETTTNSRRPVLDTKGKTPTSSAFAGEQTFNILSDPVENPCKSVVAASSERAESQIHDERTGNKRWGNTAEPVHDGEQQDEGSSEIDNLVYPSTPERSPSIAYTFGTPASSRASPIRDTNLISLPIRSELDAVLRDVVQDLNAIDRQNLADLERIYALGTTARKLHGQAKDLRASLRAEKGNRERLENYVAAWKKLSPGWTIRDVYKGQYLVESNPDGEFYSDMRGGVIEIDVDELDANTKFVEPVLPVELGSHGPFIKRHRQPLKPGTASRNEFPRTLDLKRRRNEEEAVDEEEGRYEHRSRSQEPTTHPQQTAESIAH
ncbi:hypothetical protein H0H87_008256 [Tephrocybe sp. NHM501043]|nr:hypothetical protein H0H87_008256 [Tephrocybe sp. NHM501043]